MSSNTVPPKRHHRNRLGERRRDPSSSQDASEEDNDDITSDVGSTMSAHDRNAHAGNGRAAPPPALPLQAALGAAGISQGPRRGVAQKRLEDLSAGEGSQSEALDSPTYDGDVESSSTIGGTPVHTTHAAAGHNIGHHRRPPSPTLSPGSANTPQAPSQSPHIGPRVPTPKASNASLIDSPPPMSHTRQAPEDVPVAISVSLPQARKSQTLPLSSKPGNSALGPPKMTTRPKELPLEDIREFVQRAIDGRGEEDGVDRWWKTNAPPDGQVVRVYADGVYDLFHFGHALQLRQAKLSFPQVHLLVGVSSDSQCAAHKNAPAMTHAERCEAVRHCRWVDEILPDAPWAVDQAWLEKHKIDYIAHDELVYPGAGHDDVYAFAKSQGRFVPTRRTPAISTSDLIERIVRGYRDGFFDSKLEKNGHPELVAADVDWDSSTEKREEREKREKKLAKAREQAVI